MLELEKQLSNSMFSIHSNKSAYERATSVRACNYVKIETGRNFPPALKIVTYTVQAA